MRNRWIYFLLLAVTTARLSAQLPAGEIAPDFTTTDINGQTWHLYDLLDQDKIVLLEIGTTWCGPCWAYHNSGALKEFYELHGPAGDGSVQVLFIEGDPGTNLNCLYGQPGCGGSGTLGNWVDGTPYPVIDDASIAAAYQLTYYPTLFLICPNHKAYEIGQINADKLWQRAHQCPVAFAERNAGIFEFSSGTSLHEVCGDLPLTPSFKLTNLGSMPLTSALVQLSWNSSPLQALPWNGYLSLYGEAPITFDPVVISGPGLLETSILEVNTLSGDDNTVDNMQSSTFVQAFYFSGQQIVLKLRTDNFGAETYWELRDAAGNVLDHGGNEAVGPDGGGKSFSIPGGPGAYGNMAFIRDTLNLPAPGCYSIHFVDAYGDGICCNFGNGFYRLYNLDDNTTPILSGGQFEAYDNRGFGVEGGATRTFEAAALQLDWALFPNPVTEVLHLNYQLEKPTTVHFTIFDAQGQVVLEEPEHQENGEQSQLIPVGTWPPGLYVLRWQGDSRMITRTFLVARSR